MALIAVDFDGTIDDHGFPDMGAPREKIVKQCLEWQQQGIDLTLWTCRENRDRRPYLDEALAFCKDLGLSFVAVNENYGVLDWDARKIFCDYFLDDKAACFIDAKEEVAHNHQGKLKTIAMDCDGTLFEHRYPEFGEPRQWLIDWTIDQRKNGVKVVLWTCRENLTERNHLDEAVEKCAEFGLEFDAVNGNLDEIIEPFDNWDSRKIFCDIYVDDRNLFIKDGDTAGRFTSKGEFVPFF